MNEVPGLSRSLEEIGKAADEIVPRIEKTLSPEDRGKFLAVSIDSEDFEIGTDETSVLKRLKARRPNDDLWLARVGESALYTIRTRLRADH